MKKLRQYAKEHGVLYRTAWNHFHKGLIKGAYQLDTGTIVVPDDYQNPKNEWNVIYVRVSSSENKDNLNSQAERISNFCIANGWQINEIIKEVGSGVNDSRKKLNKILEEGKATRLIVEHKDRLTRFGFNYIKLLCNKFNCQLIVINEVQDSKDRLVEDFVSIITSFCAKLYGQRRSKRKTIDIIKTLEEK